MPLKYMTAMIREKLQSSFITTVINTKTNKKGKSLRRLPYPLKPHVKFDNMDIIQYISR